jgi:hypothetical protein
MLAIKGGRTRVYPHRLLLSNNLLIEFIRFEENMQSMEKII